MNLDFLDILWRPEAKTRGTLGTVGTSSIHGSLRVPSVPVAAGNSGNEVPVASANSSQLFPVDSHTPGTKNASVYAFVPHVPDVPAKNGPLFGNSEAQRLLPFPRCPHCSSHALYRKNNVGNYECLTCGVEDIPEADARRIRP